MLNDCNYDKTKILKELASLHHFLIKHAKEDATKEGHELCKHMYDDLAKDLEKHIDKLKMAVSGLSKEEKYH